MPADNYLNINATNPGTGWKPQGFLGGMTWAQDRANYEQMADLQKQMTAASLDRTLDENNEYKLDAPVREAERPKKMSDSGLATMLNNGRMQNPKYAPTMIGGEMGKAKEQAAQGAIAEGTAQGTIDYTNATNALKQLDVAADELQRMGATNPAIAQASWTKIRSTIPPQFQNHFSPMYSPQEAAKLKAFVENANTELSKHLRKKDEIALTGEWHNKGTQITANATVESARIRAEAAKRDGVNSYRRALASGNEFAIAASGEMLLNDPDIQLSEGERSAIERVTELAKKGYAQRRAQGQQGIGDIRQPGSTYNRILNDMGGTRGIQPGPNQQLGNQPSTIKYDRNGNRVP